MDGFLNIDKPAGVTSFVATCRAARAVGAAKAGHAGTLDPFATGVLPVAIGEATKAVRYLHLDDKVYRAVVRFGVATDTLDITGRVVETRDASHVTAGAVRDRLAAFTGEIVQRPPAYSAIKVGGRRLSDLARRGRPVEPPLRKVRVHEIRLLGMDGPDATIEVRCGAGTYVRALARDLGEALGNCAVLASLVRTSYGVFEIPDSVPPDRAAGARLCPIADAIPRIPRVSLSPEGEARVRRGVHLDRAFFEAEGCAPPPAGTRLALIGPGGSLVAVALAPAAFPAAGRCAVERVFNEKSEVGSRKSEVWKKAAENGSPTSDL